jgi:hypothetical protein
MFLFFSTIFIATWWLTEKFEPVQFALDMTWQGPASKGQIFWKGPDSDFKEKSSISFDTEPGRKVYRLPLAQTIAFIRLDPAATNGQVILHGIRIGFLRLPLASWGAHNRFAGWDGVKDVEDIVVDDHGLSFKSVGLDPIWVSPPLESVIEHAVMLKKWLPLVASLLLVLFGAGFSRFLEKRSSRPRLVKRETYKRFAMIFFVALSLSLIGLAAYFYLLSYQKSAINTQAGLDYSFTLVSANGEPLSTRLGNVKVVLDPFLIYKNLPNQKTEYFSIDEFGYRTSRISYSSGLPRVVVLGGSTAFGHGLASDSAAIHGVLQDLDPNHHYINAAVIGHLSGQELSEMVHYADRLSPKLYVAINGWNDLYGGMFDDLERAYQVLGFNFSVFGEIQNQLRRAYLNIASPNSRGSRVYFGNEFGQRKFERLSQTYIENIEKMHLFAKARGVKFLVVFQPELGSHRNTEFETKLWDRWDRDIKIGAVEFSALYRKMIGAAKAYCQRHGIAHIDITESEEYRIHKGEFFLDQVHPNAQGANTISKSILGFIRSF